MNHHHQYTPQHHPLHQQQPITSPSQPVNDTGAIRCICQITEDDGNTIFCDQCGYWQHLSCLGLTGDSDLPEKWYCWTCRPDDFEWVTSSAQGTSGNTLAASLDLYGVHNSHWRPDYVHAQRQQGIGLGLEIVPNSGPTSIAQPYIARSSASSLKISNLLSPAPGSSRARDAPFPATPPRKMLLDPAKAKRKQEERKRQEDRLLAEAKAKKAAVASLATSSGISADIGRNSNVNGNGTATSTSQVGSNAAIAHGRKASTAVEGPTSTMGSKSKTKKTTASSAGPSSGAIAGPSNAITSSNAAATSTSGRKRPSAIAAVKQKKEKERQQQQDSITITPRLPPNALPPLHSQSMTPTTPYSLLGPGQSPRYPSGPYYTSAPSPLADHVANGPYVARQSGLSTSVMPPPPSTNDRSTPMDYFTTLGVPNPSRSTDPYYIAASSITTTPLEAPYAPPPPHMNGFSEPLEPSPIAFAPRPEPLPPPRSPHLSSLGLLPGSTPKVVEKGSLTGSEVVRPQPLIIRSFSTSDGSASSGLSLFLDPDLTNFPISPLQGPSLEIGSRRSSKPMSNRNSLPPRDRLPSMAVLSPSPFADPSLPIPLPASTASPLPRPFAPSLIAPQTPQTPLPTSTHNVNRPNVVLRPLICQDDRKGKARERESIHFETFALRNLRIGDRVVLGWEKLDGEIQSDTMPLGVNHGTLEQVRDTFMTCGRCGRRAKDCADEVIAAIAQEKATLLVPATMVNGTGTKRTRSRATSEEQVVVYVDGDQDRAAKRPRILSHSPTRDAMDRDDICIVEGPAVTVVEPEAEAKPESSAGVDLSFKLARPSPGMPQYPSHRSAMRAGWKDHLKTSEAQQTEILARLAMPLKASVQVPGLGISGGGKTMPDGALLPRTPPIARITTAAAAASRTSSPLTEQSDSVSDAESEEIALSRSPMIGSNPTVKMTGLAKRRIESTPPSDTERDVEAPAAQSSAVPAPVRAILTPTLSLHSTPLHLKGPPRFRRWLAKTNAHPVGPLTPPTSIIQTPSTTTPTAPVILVRAEEMKAPAPLSDSRLHDQTSHPPPSTSSRSINLLLNPAPERSRPPPSAIAPSPPAPQVIQPPVLPARETSPMLPPSMLGAPSSPQDILTTVVPVQLSPESSPHEHDKTMPEAILASEENAVEASRATSSVVVDAFQPSLLDDKLSVSSERGPSQTRRTEDDSVMQSPKSSHTRSEVDAEHRTPVRSPKSAAQQEVLMALDVELVGPRSPSSPMDMDFRAIEVQSSGAIFPLTDIPSREQSPTCPMDAEQLLTTPLLPLTADSPVDQQLSVTRDNSGDVPAGAEISLRPVDSQAEEMVENGIELPEPANGSDAAAEGGSTLADESPAPPVEHQPEPSSTADGPPTPLLIQTDLAHTEVAASPQTAIRKKINFKDAFRARRLQKRGSEAPVTPVIADVLLAVPETSRDQAATSDIASERGGTEEPLLISTHIDSAQRPEGTTATQMSPALLYRDAGSEAEVHTTFHHLSSPDRASSALGSPEPPLTGISILDQTRSFTSRLTPALNGLGLTAKNDSPVRNDSNKLPSPALSPLPLLWSPTAVDKAPNAFPELHLKVQLPTSSATAPVPKSSTSSMPVSGPQPSTSAVVQDEAWSTCESVDATLGHKDGAGTSQIVPQIPQATASFRSLLQQIWEPDEEDLLPVHVAPGNGEPRSPKDEPHAAHNVGSETAQPDQQGDAANFRVSGGDKEEVRQESLVSPTEEQSGAPQTPKQSTPPSSPSTEKKPALKLRDRIFGISVATPLPDTTAQQVAASVLAASMQSTLGVDRYHQPPPSPTPHQPPPPAVKKLPPTEPRSSRFGPAAQPLATEEGEITSTSPASSPAPPTQPRSQRAASIVQPSVKGPTRSSPPPPSAPPPRGVNSRGNPPSGPRALREGPPSHSRGGPSRPQSYRDERERDRDRDRDSRRDREREYRDAPRDSTWERERRERERRSVWDGRESREREGSYRGRGRGRGYGR